MRAFTLLSLTAAGGVALLTQTAPSRAEQAVRIPAPAVDQAPSNRAEVAVLAGGCFWGLEAVFEGLKGVQSVTSGYAGGTRQTATYDQVSTETTGHAEAIRIVFNPAQITYGKLLQVYFSVAHDPTQLNRQGPDNGMSYRSAIFPQTTDQGGIARKYIAQLGKARSYPRPIVTRIENGAFFPAEAYHQDFARRNPNHGYIVRFDAPKIKALRANFPGWMR
jgi:peptide-methionine (S)-S-oxide reductase